MEIRNQITNIIINYKEKKGNNWKVINIEIKIND